MDSGTAESNNKQRTTDQKVSTPPAPNQNVMDIKEAEDLVNKKLDSTDKMLAMMEALHMWAQDRIIELMQRDLKDSGIEND